MTLGPLLAVLLAPPVRAEFCLMEWGAKGRGNEPSFYKLLAPKCPGGDQLVFGRRWNLAGYSEEAVLVVSDFFPPVWGTRERCRAAAAGVEAVAPDQPTYVLVATLNSKIGFTGMLPRVFTWGGTCESFRREYREKLIPRGPQPAAVLKAIGAKEIENGAFVEFLIKAGKPKRKA